MKDIKDKIQSTIIILIKLIFLYIPKDILRYLSLKQKDVTSNIIVITGGGSGIGKRVAEILALEKGAYVMILDIDKVNGKKTEKEINDKKGHAKFYYCDVRDSIKLNIIANNIEKEYGKVDIIICNAAILYFALQHQLTDEQIKQAFDVNVHGTLNTIRAFLPSMEKRNEGQIVTICSITGWVGESYGMAYCPTKFAIRGIMETLQMEFDDRNIDGVKTTTIYPYFVRTPMILNKGIRPTSRWIPFMSVNRCSRNVIDAILKEKVHAFVPNYLSIITFVNSLLGRHTRRLMRNYLNCKYTPAPESSFTIIDKDCNEILSEEKSPKMPSKKEIFYFKSPSTIWWIIIPTALIFNFIVYKNVTLLPLNYMGQVGTFLSRFENELNYIAEYTNIFAVVAHLGEALYSMHLCSSLKISTDASVMWFFQTLLLGFPSLSILMRKKHKQPKHKKRGD
ncbi:Epidermal retinol dehydrogenase 2 [Strongyloides ratti]|uniref:Epidermal retinol dehydrogenase 2 n=1 Tax=Strongyloides ratti TaxID=34506 RepID=A0A090L1V1_STRRB|nr:Epidermal retinol dehydrogenase 2 [Strongyloides ratti]CEF62092.1 Epidermal retinol dehydrogenase 2 [Strongyloides ratti]